MRCTYPLTANRYGLGTKTSRSESAHPTKPGSLVIELARVRHGLLEEFDLLPGEAREVHALYEPRQFHSSSFPKVMNSQRHHRNLQGFVPDLNKLGAPLSKAPDQDITSVWNRTISSNKVACLQERLQIDIILESRRVVASAGEI